jgi:hypothetical protein
MLSIGELPCLASYTHMCQDLVLYIVRVRHHDNHPPGSRISMVIWVKRTRNSCSLSVKKKNGSHHLVFWSLENLTGLKF